MSEELAKENGLKIGQKVLYPCKVCNDIHMNIETIKDVVLNYNDEVVILVEGTEGYINLDDIYTRENINNLFDFYEDKTKVKMEEE